MNATVSKSATCRLGVAAFFFFFASISVTALWVKIARASAIPKAISIIECENDGLEGLRGTLAIELGAVSRNTKDWIERHQPAVLVQCTDTYIDVQVNDPKTGRFSGQQIPRDRDVQSDPKRFVALTVVELLATVANLSIARSVQTNQNSTASTTTTARSDSVRISEDTLPETSLLSPGWPRHRLHAAFSMFGGQQPFALLPGVALRYAFFIRSHIGVQLDGQFHTGNKAVRLGDVKSRYFTGGLLAMFRLDHRVGEISAGVGMRIGQAAFFGTASESENVAASRMTGFFGGPCVALVNAFQLPRFQIVLNTEAGYTTFEVVGMMDTERVVSQSGVWFVAMLGLGVVF